MGFKFETKGFDELSNRLEELSSKASENNGEHQAPLEEVFSDSFMAEHTGFDTFEAFLAAGGFNGGSQEAFDAIDSDEIDRHVAATTNFDSWEDFAGEAAAQYLIEKIFD